MIKGAAIGAAVGLLLTTTTVDAGPLTDRFVPYCVNYVHQINPSSRFDAYVTRRGSVTSIGTARDFYTFSKCLENNGVTLYADN
jgi:hypothetical protein